jgi:hypothetical protein
MLRHEDNRWGKITCPAGAEKSTLDALVAAELEIWRIVVSFYLVSS